MVLARKVDATQREIVDLLRALGFSVFSLASVGRGCPDLVIARQGRNYLVECKNGFLGWKLTDAQRKFRANWNADVIIFDGVDSVIAWEKRLHVEQKARQTA